MNDNTTPMSAAEYDNKINNTIPYYSEFYAQTLDVITQCGFSELDWLESKTRYLIQFNDCPLRGVA